MQRSLSSVVWFRALGLSGAVLAGCGDGAATQDTEAHDTSTSTNPSSTETTPGTESSTSVSASGPEDTSGSTGSTSTSSGTSGSTDTTGGSSSSSEGSSSSSGAGSSSESSSTVVESTGGSDSGVIFIDPSETGGIQFECDPWLQDCPDGEKCMPWANDGGNSWNALRCSPVDPDPAEPGDACTVEGSGVSGIDNCALGSMCWGVDTDTNMGTCVAFCTGSELAPSCADPTTHCVISNDNVLILCLPMCDPLLQDCGVDETCIGFDGAFLCVPDASGDQGVAGDPCEYLNVCDPGLSCVAPDALPACFGASGCCSPYCDVSDAGANAACAAAVGVGAECVPFFADGEAPPGFENVGVCSVPA